MSFSGSYVSEDVTFLLKPVRMAPTALEAKESLLRSGRLHYSEMTGEELPPDGEYLALFEDAFAFGRQRLAKDVARLALALAARPPGEIVLASLARAGTPLGVLLRRALLRLGRKTFHYSISIIRDRGIDENALDHILDRHVPASVVFVDGWTGKGAIAEELRRAVFAYNGSRGVLLDPSLVVISDLAGVAGLAASADDYLIPCSLLSSVISGLVSRTILHRDHVAPGDFHACVFHEELRPQDRSRWFVDAMARDVEAALPGATPVVWRPETRRRRRIEVDGSLESVAAWHRISDWNRIKPGLGEATRALLRRVPERLLIEHAGDPDLKHLLLLAKRRGVTVEPCQGLAYRAVALLLSAGGGK